METAPMNKTIADSASNSTAIPAPPPAADRAPSLPPLTFESLPGYPQALKTSAVAALLNCSERHVTELAATGRLKAIPGMGRNLRFTPAALLSFVNGELAEEVA
jgi:hypothetical protein